MTGPLVLLAAGGTGGHLFPAEALAQELLRRGRSVALVTDRRGSAFSIRDVPTYRIPAGRSGAGLAAKLRGAVDVARGMLAAGRLMKRLRPRSVVGFGGYPSLPTMLTATRLRLPTVIHDQNAVLGRANRMLAPRVRRIAISFETVSGVSDSDRSKLIQTGNPVRAAIQELRTRHYAPPPAEGDLHLLVTGGSQGARIMSRVVPSALALLPDAVRMRLRVSQQARAEDAESAAATYSDAGIEADVQPFFEDIADRLGRAHLVVSRAGGSTVAELTVSGRPSILVPFAAAIADEQTANAEALAERGAAWVMPEREFTGEALAELGIRLLNDPARLARAAAEAHALGRPQAASDLADLVEATEAGGRA